jgi:hypothetical protein
MAWVSLAQARRDPRVRKRIQEALFRVRVRAEALATPSWARRAVNTPVAGDLNYQVDVAAAIAANFAAA